MSTCRTKSSPKTFLDASTNARDFPTITEDGGRSDLEALWLKISKYTQARLDKGLRELGVDPSQYNAVDPDQKKKIFEDALTNKSIERTSIALGGINVVGNFVHEGETSHVGVVIAYSPSIEGLAQSLRMGKKPAIQAVWPTARPANPPRRQASHGYVWSPVDDR